MVLFQNVGLYVNFLKCCGAVGHSGCQEDGRGNMYSPICFLTLVEGASRA